MLLADVMTRDLLIVEPTATVNEAVEMMGARGAGSVLVMEGDTLVGIFTERDVMRSLAQEYSATAASVSETMTKHPVTVPRGVDAHAALDIMLERGFRHLPVVDEHARVCGLVSMRDIARVLGTA